jgi:hypothetical protein
VRLGEILQVPWLLPGVGVSLVVGTVASGAVGRALGVRRVAAWVLLLSFGIILSATLTPRREAFESGARVPVPCDLSRLGPPSLEELLRFGDVGLNILMFVPLGAAIALVPRSRRRAAIVGGAIALPLGIEAIQALVPWLDRTCESADIVDNLAGLVIGLAAGTVIGRLVPGLGRPAERSRPSVTG